MILGFDISGYFFKLFFEFRILISKHFFRFVVQFVLWLKGVNFSKESFFNGIPKVSRAPYSKIIFKKGCRINSSKSSVKEGIYKKCTFVTLKHDAKIVFGENSGATGVSIIAASNITIGKNVLIGAYCMIIDNDLHASNPHKREFDEFKAKPVVIEDNVFLGFNCIVLKGVKIGANSVIAANSLVISSIPENSFAMGNPCKVVMKRNWDK
jgi:acetyltransferase-like isoleucine patch superfamily enzyme